MKQPILRNALLLFAAVGMAAIPSQAFAHQVQTNYILNSQTRFQPDAPTSADSVAPAERAVESLELQSTFSNGQPLKGAKVTVFAPEQSFRPYTTGVTDGQGRFTFEPNVALTGEWEVKIKRDGHSDIIYVPVTESGIDADLIAKGGKSDMHYAGSPLAAVGSIAIAAACIGFARVSSKREAK
ncbi:MAG: carboxypeptidase-like regulatory domain-containing protein [Phormidesmis sp.]